MSRLGVLILGSSAVILCWQLMVPPVVGVANNGDFGKLLGSFGLGAPTEHESAFADTKYTFDTRYRWEPGFRSSELLLIRLALALNALVSKDGQFDLRLIGFVHGVLLLAAILLLLPLLDDLPPWQSYLLGFSIVFVFSDVAYVGYLNSFYMDVAAYLFLLLAIVAFLRVLKWRRTIDSALMVASSVLLITSKPQHAALGLWIALLFLLQGELLWSKSWVARGTVAAGLVLVSIASLRYTSPPDYSVKGCFTTIFLQILPHSKDLDRTMVDLGLDANFAKWIGKHAYSDGVQLDDSTVVATLQQRISYGRLARFFLTHPRDAYVALHNSLSAAGRHRPVLGNFDSNSGMRAFAESGAFALWSDWKRTLFFHRGTRFLLCFILLALTFSSLLVAQHRQLPNGAFVGGVVLLAMACTEMVVASLADALDHARHHLLFFAHCDLLFLLTLYLCSQVILSRRRACWAK